MKPHHQIGMILGYYLSRMDREGYRHLGLGNIGQTHEKIGQILGVQPESVKNWRDEFDPIHPNSRKGWWKREMFSSRLRVIEALESMPDLELTQLIDALLEQPDGYIASFLIALTNDESLATEQSEASNRQQTGQWAEELFIQFHGELSLPVAGHLEDRRVDMCGYDFAVKAASEEFALEVKGLAKAPDRFMVSLTGKEWSVAQDMRENYFLVAVCDVYGSPDFVFIQDPASHLDASKYVYTTPTLTWRARVDRARFETVSYQPSS
jgi:hypothetical protein